MNDVVLAIVILIAALVACFVGGFHAGRIFERWKISRKLASTITEAVAQCIADPKMAEVYGVKLKPKPIVRDRASVQPGNDSRH